MCQWFKHLAERLRKMPHAVRLEWTFWVVRYVIPKLHIRGHLPWCMLYFSLNYMLGAGRTDGEGIEHNWANTGPVSTSTQEMGLGHHRNTLEDHWGYWNITKLFGLGKHFLLFFTSTQTLMIMYYRPAFEKALAKGHPRA